MSKNNDSGGCGCLTLIIAIVLLWWLFTGGCSLISRWTDRKLQELEAAP